MDEESIQFAAQQMQSRTVSLISNQKNKAAEGIEKLAQAIKAMGQKLEEQDQKRFSDLTLKAAVKVDEFGRSIREKEVEELLGDVKRLAREHPVILCGSAFALGFVLSRFVFPPAEKKEAASIAEIDRMPEDEELWEKGI